MNKLFITTVFALLLALTASAGVSYLLALNPPFKMDSENTTKKLEDTGRLLFQTLQPLPEEQWGEALIPFDEHYIIDWYPAQDFNAQVEDRTTLSSSNQVLTHLVDGTPVLEILFAQKKLVLEVVPLEGFDKRWIQNVLATIASVLVIGLLAALLTLAPIAQRLKQLQILARSYSDGHLHIRNTDTAGDAIGKLGTSMESMADRVDSLLNDKELLVHDQQELMRAVAHEFRAPMARMRFALEMHEGTGEFPDESKKELGLALDDLDEMVTEVLRYARLQRSAPELPLSEVRLNSVVQEAIVSVQAIRPEVIIETAESNESVMVAVEPVQFQRALRNLLSNALKYTNNQVSIRYENRNHEFAIHVDDNGQGISEEYRERILAPFVRLDSSRTRKLGGSGLGLAIVNGVMIKHGGRINITESSSGGARFSMILPEESFWLV